MAYKFSLGTYRHSGSMVAEEGITVDSGGLTVTGSVSLPAGEINTAELADAAVTAIKLATDAVETAKIKDANVTTAKIADANVTNAKLQYSGSILGSTAVDLGATVASLAGLTSVSATSLTGALAVANIVGFSGSVENAVSAFVEGSDFVTFDDGTGTIGVNASTFTGSARAVLNASDGINYNVSTGMFSLTSSVAGAGLGLTSGVLDVLGTGAIALKNDRVALSSSVAGDGLGFIASGLGDVSQLKVNVDASSIEINADALRVKALGITNAMLSGAIENDKLAGSISNDKLANSSITVTAGDALSGGGLVALGSSIELDVVVDDAALAIVDDKVALKSTISGSRTFQHNVTIEGDLIVTGTTFSASVGTLLVEDAKITIADGALALAGGQGFEVGNNLASFVVGDGSSSNSAFVSSLELKASKFIGAVEGTLADSLQTLSDNGNVTASVVLCDASSGGFTATLPSAAGKSGQFYKVKKSEGSANGVTVAASGSQTIDGVASIVLESPYAAVMLASNGSNWFVF